MLKRLANSVFQLSKYQLCVAKPLVVNKFPIMFGIREISAVFKRDCHKNIRCTTYNYFIFSILFQQYLFNIIPKV
jgi:hypothetical protein